MFGFWEHVIHTVCLSFFKIVIHAFFAKGKHIELTMLRVKVIMEIYSMYEKIIWKMINKVVVCTETNDTGRKCLPFRFVKYHASNMYLNVYWVWGHFIQLVYTFQLFLWCIGFFSGRRENINHVSVHMCLRYIYS